MVRYLFNFYKKIPKCFQKCCVILHSHQQWSSSSANSISNSNCQEFYVLTFCFSHSNKSQVSCGSINLHSPQIKDDAEHLFMCLSVTCIFSLVKCLDPLTILNKSSSNNSNMWIILTGWIHSTLSNSGLPPGHFLYYFMVTLGSITNPLENSSILAKQSLQVHTKSDSLPSLISNFNINLFLKTSLCSLSMPSTCQRLGGGLFQSLRPLL